MPSPDPVTTTTASTGPEWWELLDSLGSFLAALAAMVTIIITVRQLRRAALEAAGDERRRYELGLLREMLDSIPTLTEDNAAMNFYNPSPALVTEDQFVLLSLLPEDVLPRFRQILIATKLPDHERDEVLNAICSDYPMPGTFSLLARVRRAQRRECLEAIAVLTGGNPREVGAWFARVDGRLV